ncbi:CsbD family protein [Methylobacterium aquaticum]|uniref:CsbD-like domain-containing protein n=1 Tax=Methylobacterium aquaticum TaxID=270351 RepID=A0A0J6SAX7_9HYPH|nr:CsbD family protein [Methylobacterium aquaticum]KMO30513.1 hypothetical protein VP06_21650 [Methylobacterium aquaticum]
MTESAPKTFTDATCTEQVKGSVKEAIGKLTGDVRVEAEGRRQKGKAHPARGPIGSPRGDGPYRD